jgi:hypothetical protein
MIGGLGTWAGAIAIVIAAWLGRNAIADFREQKLAERRIEYAEKLLSKTRLVNDAIRRIRQRYPSEDELIQVNSILTAETDGKPLSQDHIDATIARERLKNESSTFDGLRQLLPLAGAYFGEDVEKQARRFLRIPHIIANHANRLWNVGHDAGVDATLYYTGGKADTITNELQKSSEALDEALKAHLSSGG